MEKPKILQVVADGTPGGGTTHVLGILNKLGTEYSLGLATQDTSYLKQEAQKIKVPCLGLDFFKRRVNLTLPRMLKSYITEFRPNLIHIHGARAGFSTILTNTEIPIVYTVHGYHFLQKSFLLYNLTKITERFIHHKVRHTIFVSKYDNLTAQRLSLIPSNENTSIIYNGINLQIIPKNHHIDQKLIGFVGRLVEQKNPLLFLEIMAALPNYQAVIVGGGELECAVKQKINKLGLAERVQLLGSLNHKESLDVIASINLLLITSKWEGLPYLPLEAMWSGTPVISTKVGGIPEIITNQQDGILVTLHEPQEFAAAIESLNNSPNMRSTIIKNAKRKIRENFSEEKMYAEISNVYQRILSQRIK